VLEHTCPDHYSVQLDAATEPGYASHCFHAPCAAVFGSFQERLTADEVGFVGIDEGPRPASNGVVLPSKSLPAFNRRSASGPEISMGNSPVLRRMTPVRTAQYISSSVVWLSTYGVSQPLQVSPGKAGGFSL